MTAIATTWRTDRYTSDDFASLMAMAQRNLGDVDFAQERFCRWQYNENPAGEAVIVVARDEDNGEIIGQNVVLPVRMLVGGREVLAGLCLNTLTDEKHRGKGVFAGLGEAVTAESAARSIEFLFRFPNQNSYPGITGKLKFTDIGELPLLVRPLNWRRLVHAKTGNALAGLLAGAAGGVLEAGPALRGAPKLPPNQRILEVTEFDERFDEFWERNRGRFSVMVIRRRDYLNWRFARSPVRKYRTWLAEEGSRILGYMVLRQKEMFGVSTGLLVDFFVDDSREGMRAGRALLHAAIEEFRGWGADLAGTLCLEHTVECRILRGGGFRPCPRKLMPRRIPACVRIIAREAEPLQPLLNLRNWCVTMGDFDNV